jgi:peroxiredoxin
MANLPPAGVVAPDFTVTDPSGKPLHLADYRGKVVILDFWATWCHPCLEWMAKAEDIAQRYQDQGLVVLASATFDAPKNVDAWLRQNRSRYPHVTFASDPAGGGKGANNDNAVARKLYGVRSLPTQFVIGRDGRIVSRALGYEGDESPLEEALATAGLHVADATAKPADKTAGVTTNKKDLFGTLSQFLALSEQQSQQVKPAFDTLAEQQRQIKADTSLSDEQRTEKLNAAFATTKESIRPALSEEQWQRLANLHIQFDAGKRK